MTRQLAPVRSLLLAPSTSGLRPQKSSRPPAGPPASYSMHETLAVGTTISPMAVSASPCARSAACTTCPALGLGLGLGIGLGLGLGLRLRLHPNPHPSPNPNPNPNPNPSPNHRARDEEVRDHHSGRAGLQRREHLLRDRVGLRVRRLTSDQGAAPAGTP